MNVDYDDRYGYGSVFEDRVLVGEDDEGEYENAMDDEPIVVAEESTVDFEDPAIAALPKVLLMGPRRGGKSSIQVS
jgi:hypothetical protein